MNVKVDEREEAEMLSKEEIKKWLLDNCIDENGDLDLRDLDFSDFEGDVDISGMSVKKNLMQNLQEVGGYLCQDNQIVEEDLDQHEQRVKGTLCQYGQEVGKNLIQEKQKVGGDLFQHHQKAKGSIYQNYQKAGCDLYQDEQEAGGRTMQVPNGHEGEPKCVGPDCEAECERLRKELREADRKNEVLLWALGKAMEVGK